ncbi:glycosyl transferase, partial [Streptomyces pharetrae]
SSGRGVESFPQQIARLSRCVWGGGDPFVWPFSGPPAAGPAPRTAPEAAHHYSITRSAARLMDVYARTASPSPSPSPQEVTAS